MTERLIAHSLAPFLARNAYGTNQWAYRRKCGSKDLLCFLQCSWILAICREKQIGVYFSDIEGAFDRVFAQCFLAKVRQLGICDKIVDLFGQYLSPRIANVVVAGECSDLFEISDMVFQGTVLGPLLWNVFFADVAVPATSNNEQEVVCSQTI